MNTLIKAEILTDAISLTPVFYEQRNDALLLAKQITLVSNNKEQSEAFFVLKTLESLTRSIEKSRKEVKEPVLGLIRKIDSLAKEATASIEDEIKRIGGSLASYQSAVLASQKKIEEEERKKQTEALLEKSRQEAAMREALKKEDLTEDEVDEIVLKKQRLEEDTLKVLIETNKTMELAVSKKEQGMIVKSDVDFEITDLKVFYSNYPYLCDIVPKKAFIKSAIKHGQVEHGKGIIFNEVKKVGVRL